LSLVPLSGLWAWALSGDARICFNLASGGS
jgi:hypothetical protein